MKLQVNTINDIDNRSIIVSIITPAYNAAGLIAETIDSVLQQTYQNWEMIIVDDCSIDDTIFIVKGYQERDSRIRLIELKDNTGVAHARNVGIESSCGRYLAFLDSDDIWLENKLEEQLYFMKSNKIAFSFTQYRQFNNEIAECKKIIDIPEVVNYKMLLRGNVIGCLTVMLDKEMIPTFKMIRERHEDYIAWLEILKQGYQAYGIRKDLARYRISSASISANKKKSVFWTWNVYYKVEKLSFFESMYYLVYYLLNAVKKRC